MAGNDAKSDLWWLIIVLVILGLVWFLGGGPSRPAANQGPFLEPPVSVPAGNASERFYGSPAAGEPASAGAKRVKISLGNAQYEVQANKEYITLEADWANKTPIAISGWKLKSARRNEAISIPRVSKLFIRQQAADTDPVMLAPGERAVMVTGYPPDDDTIGVGRGFKLNSCSGYLDKLLSYRFSPALNTLCPAPRKEPGADSLYGACYDFVQRLSPCRTPKSERRGEIDYVDNDPKIDNDCRAYLERHFNYDGCLKWHQSDQDFWSKEWRVYLYHTGELWSDRAETVSLYDETGKLVDEVSYGQY